MKSVCDLLIYRVYQETWQRGEKYADEGRVKILEMDDGHIKAIVKGTKKYETSLAFKSGGVSRKCSCPISNFCKHMVAVAIVWDGTRGFRKPSKEEIENETIPPPAVSRSQITEAYNDPVNADLDIIRIAADEMGWSRPHARLPNMPKFNADVEEPLTLDEVKESFKEIEKWENRRNYDLYFCAGEMVAAFCEVMRIVKKRLSVSDPLMIAETLREAQKFHYKLVMELIDDSDGLHEFIEAQLEDIHHILKSMEISNDKKTIFEQKLHEFEMHRDDY